MRTLIVLAASSLTFVLAVSNVAGQAPRSMSFQGYLADTLGTPVDGPQTLTLRLYDAGTAGSEIWTRTYAGVGVKNGVFDVVLEDGSPSFKSLDFVDSLWIEVAVASEVLTPRTQLRMVPYAAGLSLPVLARGNIGSHGSAAFKVINTATGVWNYSIYGQNDSESGHAVYGHATAGSGISYGVYGETNSTEGVGVKGYATSDLGLTYGVWGESDAKDGRGVYGKTRHATGVSYGVYGESRSTHGRGIYGSATSTTGPTYGVYGRSASTSGIAVYGDASASTGFTRGVYGAASSSDGRGVYGQASNISGTTYGVYGESNSASGRGVYGLAGWSFGTNYGVYGQTRSAAGWSGYFEGGQGVFALSADNNAPDLMLGGSSDGTDDGIIGTDTAYVSSDLWLYSNDAVIIRLNVDGSNEDSDFEIRNSSNVNIFNVDDSGEVRVNNTIVHASDRNRKDDIVAIDSREILDEVARLPISRWRYKGESVPHVGPMAQDFYTSFEVGSDDTHIATVDADGVALAAIQGLYELVKKQQVEIERLRQIVEGSD